MSENTSVLNHHCISILELVYGNMMHATMTGHVSDVSNVSNVN